MDLLLSHRKPYFDPSTPLCTFRSSKAYLWGLIRERLNSLQVESRNPLHILDAACHSLIARAIFPNTSLYYGLDISQSRLKSGFQVKHKSDVLYHADLCRDLLLKSCFDVVVSCNTLAHLPEKQCFVALENVINTCKKGGHLFVNTNIGQNMPEISSLLAKRFSKLEIVYFDSYLSYSDESASLITLNNIIQKLKSNEFSVPNDACLHHQVLYIASDLSSTLAPSFPPRIEDKIIRLNVIPNVTWSEFNSDIDVLRFLVSDKFNIIFLSRKLFDSSTGLNLRSDLNELHCSVFPLDLPLPALLVSNKVCILGLENEWSDSLGFDRQCINQLREITDIELKLCTVKSRSSSPCTPSLLLSDC